MGTPGLIAQAAVDSLSWWEVVEPFLRTAPIVLFWWAWRSANNGRREAREIADRALDANEELRDRYNKLLNQQKWTAPASPVQTIGAAEVFAEAFAKLPVAPETAAATLEMVTEHLYETIKGMNDEDRVHALLSCASALEQLRALHLEDIDGISKVEELIAWLNPKGEQ